MERIIVNEIEKIRRSRRKGGSDRKENEIKERGKPQEKIGRGANTQKKKKMKHGAVENTKINRKEEEGKHTGRSGGKREGVNT